MAKKDYEAPTYGTRHLMEEEQREAGVGVFERKNAGAAPANKARAAAPADKEAVSMDNTKDELLAIAKREGVEYETDDNKADLIAKIKAGRK